MSYQAMKSHERNLHAFYQVKGPNLKKVHTVQFQLSDIFGKAKTFSIWWKAGVYGITDFSHGAVNVFWFFISETG